MQFRQNGQRDERRRRVLRDELLTSPTADELAQNSGTPDGAPKVPCRGYSAAVSVESQPPISCLIATRPWTLTVLVLAAFTVIVGLEAAYAKIFHAAGLPSEVTAALNVTARGSLAAWFSSVLLSLAAVNSLLVYWLRSHKLDDYRGRYRVWLWTALGLACVAVDASTGLHSVVGYLIAGSFETLWLRNPEVNGVIFMALVCGGLAVRLGFEIWPSRLARSWSLVAAIGYLAAILIHLDVLVVDSVILAAMAESTAILVANLAVTCAVAGFCRYVYLESQGTLKPRRERPKKQAAEKQAADAPAKPAKLPKGAKKASAQQSAAEASAATPAKPAESTPPNRTLRTETVNSKSIRCDSAHQSRGEARAATTVADTASPSKQAPAPAAPATVAPATVAPAITQSAAFDDESAEDDDISDFDPETGERLSKSERRRLRKQMRRQKKTGSG